MQELAESIITVILAARTISEEEKKVLLDLFSNESVSDEELKVKLDALCAAELALREKENAALEAMREKNNAELAEEERRIAPEVEKINAEAAAEEKELITKYMQEMRGLEGALDKVEEAIKKNSGEADEMAQIRAILGIAKNQ